MGGDSLGIVFGNTVAAGVHDPEVELRIGVALFGGQPVPAHGFGIVLEDAPPAGVHVSEHELRIGETLLGSQPVPAYGFGIVLEDALAVGAHDPEVELRTGEALFGGQPKPARRFGSVLRHALAIGVHVPEVELRGGITLFRSLPDRVEIVLKDPKCREHHDCEATRHDHSSGCADQPWSFEGKTRKTEPGNSPQRVRQIAVRLLRPCG